MAVAGATAAVTRAAAVVDVVAVATELGRLYACGWMGVDI